MSVAIDKLERRTFVEACSIKVDGDNKWITLIQNAEHQRNNGAQ